MVFVASLDMRLDLHLYPMHIASLSLMITQANQQTRAPPPQLIVHGVQGVQGETLQLIGFGESLALPLPWSDRAEAWKGTSNAAHTCGLRPGV